MKLMLAKEFNGENPARWLWSEKYDGVRCLWNGKNYLSRNNNVFEVPTAFYDHMPDQVLDGEWWIGRGQFQRTVSTVKKKTPVPADWRAVRFHVFDAPDAPGGFEQRQAALAALILPGHVVIVPQAVCEGVAHLDAEMDRICSAGGEGIMLRKPGSPYTHGRTSDMLKVKRHQDAEAVVIGHEQGNGRLSGTVGALVCRAFGVQFKVGTGLDDDLRAHPPRIGTTISFCFHGLTDGGTPRHPSFLTVRDYE